MRRIFALAASAALLLTACNSGGNTPPAPQPETPPANEESEEQSSIQETKNVSYQGVVKPAGISIYMEGSHKLELPEGRFILLESNTVDLNGYVGENVEVFGAVRPTVEASGMIMRVERISLLGGAEESSEETTPSSAVAQSSVAPTPPPANQPQPPPAPPSEGEPEEPVVESTDPELKRKTELMAKNDLAPENWTQEYCTSHIGFCFPIHKNWWFKSFGNTTTYFWHVEIGPEPLENLGEGPIAVNLVTGTIESVNAEDGQVRAQGDLIVGYRSWIGNRHFEIVAPLSLEMHVRYITEHLAEEVPVEE